jgi:hypothetical protein
MSLVNVLDRPRERRAAYVPIAPSLFAELLHMPPAMKITGIALDPMTGDIHLFVDDPSFPPVPEGARIPRFRPTVTTHHDENGELLKQTWDWSYRA